MSTTHLEPMTEDEMYAIEFSPEELCEEPSAEEPEVEYHCPVCHASELQYAMHYRVSDDDETQELYRCAHCGATGAADDCRVELGLRPPENVFLKHCHFKMFWAILSHAGLSSPPCPSAQTAPG